MSLLDKILSNRKNALADAANIEALQNEYAEFAEQAATKIDALSGEIATLKATAEVWKQKYEATVAEQAKAKADARLSQLTTLFGDTKGAELHSKLSKLPDEDYAAIVDATASLQDTVDKKLEEIAGSDAENISIKPLEELSGTAKILRARYANQ